MKQWRDLSKKQRANAQAHVMGRLLQGMCSGTPLADPDINKIAYSILEGVRASDRPWMAAVKLMDNECIEAYIRAEAKKEAQKAFYAEDRELVLYVL